MEKTITYFLRNYRKMIKKIPDDGIAITFNGTPQFKVYGVDREVEQKKVEKKAKEAIRMRKIDTFNEVEVTDLEESLGICDKCGRHGPVVRKGYINEHNRIVGKWLGKNCCFNSSQGAKNVKKVVQKEQSFQRQDDPSDFSRSAEERSTF